MVACRLAHILYVLIELEVLRVECRTVSKALLKSKEMTVTDALERSMFVMVLSR